MFTGLVQEVGSVTAVKPTDGGARIQVSAPLAAELAPGDSVLVNGVCLTASEVDGGRFAADLSPETIRRSSLEQLTGGDRVNLELPLRVGDRLGGHLVQGHVDAVAEIRSLSENGGALELVVNVQPSLLRYVVEKGSVTLDGVSLTVTEVDAHGFRVSLIPETLERTTLGGTRPGSRVNLEVDVLAKYVEKLVAPHNQTQ
jgi:riboflavin synthase